MKSLLVLTEQFSLADFYLQSVCCRWRIERFTLQLHIYAIVFPIKTHVFALSALGVSVYIPLCLQGQTGALANMVWPIIISTINFH